MSGATLQQLKDHLNSKLPGGSDPELQLHLDAALEIVEASCGPLSVQTVTETVLGSVLVLSTLPVISLVSITPQYGDPAQLDYVTVDASGVVSGYTASTYGRTGARTTVVYQAGRATAPASLILAQLIIAAHQWSTQRGPQRGGLPGSDMDVVVLGSGYAVPTRAWENMQHHAVAGVA